MMSEVKAVFDKILDDLGIDVVERPTSQAINAGRALERQRRQTAYGSGFSIYYNTREEGLTGVLGYSDEFATFAFGKTEEGKNILHYRIHYGRFEQQLQFLQVLRQESALLSPRDLGIAGTLLTGEWEGGEQETRWKSIMFEDSWNLEEFVKRHANRAAKIMGASDVEVIPEPGEVY